MPYAGGAGPPWFPTLLLGSTIHPHNLLSGPCQVPSLPSPNLPLQKRSSSWAEISNRPLVPAELCGHGAATQTHRSCPAHTALCCPLLHPLFLNAEGRKFTLDLTCISIKETAPLLHLNSTGAVISGYPRMTLCSSGGTRRIPLYLQVVFGGSLSSHYPLSILTEP